MRISVVDPIDRAFGHMSQVCFKPFHPGKWFALGFTAWLAGLGEAAGGVHFQFPNFGGSGGPSPFDAIGRWIEAHLTLFLVLAGVLFVVGVAAWMLMLWLSSRGKFMFIDNIIHNRAAIGQPWSTFARVGNQLFILRLLVVLVGFLGVVLVGGISLAIASPDLMAHELRPAGVVAIIVASLGMVLLVLAAAVVTFVIEHFIVPAMYLFDISPAQAWRRVRQEILPANTGKIVLYLLMNIALGIGVGTLAMMVMCATCCIAALPYIGTVILLPVAVFLRSYNLHFVSQFGGDWTIFEWSATPAPGKDPGRGGP